MCAGTDPGPLADAWAVLSSLSARMEPDVLLCGGSRKWSRMHLGGNGKMSQTELDPPMLIRTGGAIETAGLTDYFGTQTERLRTTGHGEIAVPRPVALSCFGQQAWKISAFLITVVLPSLFLAATAPAS